MDLDLETFLLVLGVSVDDLSQQEIHPMMPVSGPPPPTGAIAKSSAWAWLPSGGVESRGKVSAACSAMSRNTCGIC
jgi:hypothetical protein